MTAVAEQRDRRNRVLIIVASLLVGALGAALAISALLASNAPNDTTVVRTGLQTLVDPGTLIPYGG
jgi:hypothetical protein